MTYKAFIFDLDGVITDTAHYHFLAWKRLADRLGIPFDEHDNERLKGVSRMRSLELILEKSTKTYSPEQMHEMAERKNDDYKELIAEITSHDILPGVAEVFAWLKAKHYKIGLASASKNAAFVVERLGITRDFDYIADAAKIPNSKPAPDVFLDVAKAFNLPSSMCVGVEDAAAGVQAIKAAGMFAVGIGDPAVLYEADLVFPSMAAFDSKKVAG